MLHIMKMLLKLLNIITLCALVAAYNSSLALSVLEKCFHGDLYSTYNITATNEYIDIEPLELRDFDQYGLDNEIRECVRSLMRINGIIRCISMSPNHKVDPGLDPDYYSSGEECDGFRKFSIMPESDLTKQYLTFCSALEETNHADDNARFELASHACINSKNFKYKLIGLDPNHLFVLHEVAGWSRHWLTGNSHSLAIPGGQYKYKYEWYSMAITFDKPVIVPM